jgi:hypothetical protein
VLRLLRGANSSPLFTEAETSEIDPVVLEDVLHLEFEDLRVREDVTCHLAWAGYSTDRAKAAKLDQGDSGGG